MNMYQFIIKYYIHFKPYNGKITFMFIYYSVVFRDIWIRIEIPRGFKERFLSKYFF